MRAIALLFLLAAAAGAQTLPQEVKDTPQKENFEYLDQQIRRLPSTPLTFSGLITFSGGVAGTLHVGSSVTFTASVARAGALGPAVAGSTLTITLPAAGDVDVSFDGPCLGNTGGGVFAKMGTLVDGAFPTDYSSTLGMLTLAMNVTTTHPCHFNRRIGPYSAGSHSFALTIGSDGAGTMTIACTTAPCQFQVREAR